jgi:hypothetical protein
MSIRKFDGANFNFWKEQMQEYLIVCGYIDPIEHDTAPATYKPEVWMKLDGVARATIRMHLSESMYYTVQSCTTAKELWKTLLDTYQNKVTATKIYLIRRLYNLRMKESNSIMAHLNEYEGVISQLSAQGMTMDDELKALLLMSTLPPSWETFVTTVCNASAAAVKYSKTTSSILSEDARRKMFVQNSASEAYTVQNTGDRQQHRERSSSRGPNMTRNRSKYWGSMTCNYCKKPGHIKTECRVLKAKNRKFTQKGSRMEEVNFCGSSSTTLRSTVEGTPEDDRNILNVESTTEAEVLLTTEEATSWLIDSGASYHVTPFRTQFRLYPARSFDPVRVGNSQHCAVLGIGTVELNLPGGSTIVLHDVRHVPELTRSLISVGQLDEPTSRQEGGVSTKGTSCLFVV